MEFVLSKRIAAIALLLLGVAGCATDGSGGAPPSAEPVLRVGMTPNYPPIVDRVDGELVGVEVDLAREVGAALGRPVELVAMPWDDLIPRLKRGEIDVVMSGMSVTEERKREVAFVEPYLRIGQMAIIRIGDVRELGSARALLSTRGTVGFERGTTGEGFVRRHMSAAQARPYDSVAMGIHGLRSGEIDVFVHDAPTVWRIGGDPQFQDLIGLYWPLTEEYLAWAVRRSDEELRRALDAQVAAMREDGRMQRILGEWIKVRVEVR